jgi:hypothetical protein
MAEHGRVAGGVAGDDVSCGKGVDLLLIARVSDFANPRCEAVSFLDPPGGPIAGVPFAQWAYPRSRRGRLIYELICRDPDDPEQDERSCEGRLTLRHTQHHRLLASGTIPRESDSSGRVRVRIRFTRLGRRLSASQNGVRATLRIRARGLPRIGWSIILNRPT